MSLSRVARVATALCFAGMLHPAPAAFGQGVPPPNIVLITIDDTGVELFNAYNQNPAALEVTGPTPPEHQVTPTIDSLAEQGVLFRNAWASPLCAPTRAALFTGTYGYRTGVISGIGDAPLVPNVAMRLGNLPEPAPDPNDRAPTTYQQRSAIGKWHLSGFPSSGDSPSALGFTSYAGSPREGGTGATGNLPSYTDYSWYVGTDLVSSGSNQQYLTTREVDAAIAFVAAQPTQSPSPPWFLWLAFHAAHTPYDTSTQVPPSSPCLQIPATPTSSEKRRIRCAQLEILDSELDRLIRTSSEDEEGVIDLSDTTVIVMGDNGSWGAAADHVPGKVNQGGKNSAFEGGINVPLIVAGQGVVDPAPAEASYGELPHLVHAVDVFATVLDLAGVQNHDGASDGISFAHALNGTAGSDRECVYADGPGANSAPLPSQHPVAIRDAQYKLIREPGGSSFNYKLFDLMTENGRREIETIPDPESHPAFDALNDELVALDADLAATPPGPASPCRPPEAPPPPSCGLGPELAAALLAIRARARRRRNRAAN